MATERDSGKYSVILKDENGNVPVLESLTFWLDNINSDPPTIVNGRNAVDALASPDFSWNSVTGQIIWQIRPDDMQIVDGNNATEDRRWTLTATWNSGLGQKSWTKEEKVTNLNRVT